MEFSLPPNNQKEEQIQKMFSSAARRYDLVNTVLSFGFHKWWKKKTVKETGLSEGDQALDVCSGTNDLAILMAKKVGSQGHITAVDFNPEMLEVGRYKVAKAGLNERITSSVENAEELKLPPNQFAAVTIGFGIRNVANREKALSEMYRVLKPGGRLVCLEFTVPPGKVFRSLYDFYSFKVLPYIGTWVSGDKTRVYHYLPASIRNFFTPSALKKMMEKVGFNEVKHYYLTGGIVAIHIGSK